MKIPLNSSKEYVRFLLPKKSPQQDKEDWAAFEVRLSLEWWVRSLAKAGQHTCKYLWDVDRLKLSTALGWIELENDDKEKALDIVVNQCETLQLDWGELLRSVARWKLYHMHKTAKMNSVHRIKGDNSTVQVLQ